MASSGNGRQHHHQSLPHNNLLANSTLPVSAPRPGMKQQSSKMTDASGTSMASNLGKLAGSFSKSLGSIRQGPFDKWTRFEIVEALIDDGETLRDENYLSVNVLRSYAERVFADREELPQRPLPYTLEEQRNRTNAASIIQNAWFNRMIRLSERNRLRTIVDESKKKFQRSFHAQHSDTNFPDISLTELGVEMVDDEYDDEDYSSEEDEETGRAMNPVLEQPWVAPSWEYARMYADYNHPRLGGLGGKEMDWLRTTTGRHCMTGGFGEQCDLWEEKQVSELGRYGPGITNYFKFIKWCFWVFVVLMVLNFPALVLNTFGRGDQQSVRINSLSQTMAGNLGDTNATQTLHYPYCQDNVRGQSCQLSKHDIALMYGYCDFMATIIILIAYIWLRVFEIKEETVLNKNTVSANNYTVAVKGFNSDIVFSEAELKKHFAEVTSQGVSCVAIAYDNEKEIDLYKTRGELMKSRIRCTQEYRYYRTLQRDEGKTISEGFLEDILDKRINTTAKIRQIDVETEHRAKLVDKPIYAFVTFEHAIGARIAIRAYNKSLWGYFNMKESLKFKGSKLIVQEAADPSTILWENLRYRRVDRSQRRILTSAVTLVLLGVSLLVNIISRTIDQNASDHGGNQLCPQGFSDLPTEEQQQMVDQDNSLLHCYCDELTLEEQKDDSYCQKYYKQTLSASLFSYFAAFIVLLTNYGIDAYLARSAQYEKHHSLDSQEKSIFLRMLLLKLINTGALFLFASFFGQINSLVGVSTPSTGDFTTSWYQTVGVGIVLVQIGDIASPHLTKLYRYRQLRKQKKAAELDPTKGALTQEELNDLHLGPEFLVSRRYAQIMANWFVCYMFCTGIPVLTVIGMINFYVSYWVDKFLFLRYYRSPPRYKSSIGRMATSIIPYAVIVHLGVSIWSLGNLKIFNSGTQGTGSVDVYGGSYSPYSIQQKISQKHTFPLFILLLVVVVALIIAKIFDEIVNVLHSLAKAIFGSWLARSEFYQELERFLLNTINISYSRAVRRGIIKGLATYNILQNPRYKEAFNISDGFALSHGRVKSLRNFGRISFEGMAELETHERGLLENASALATPEIRNLATVEEGKEIEFNYIRRPRKSTASTDDDSSVHSGTSHGSKKKTKLTSGEERTQIIMRTLEEEEEEEAILIAREAEEKEAQVARYLASISEDSSAPPSPMKTSTHTPSPTPTNHNVKPLKFEKLPLHLRDEESSVHSSRSSPRDGSSSLQSTPRQVTASLLSPGSQLSAAAAPVPTLSAASIVSVDRRGNNIPHTPLGVDTSYLDGEDYINSILSASSDSTGLPPRPVSAYVDIQQSYNQPGNRDSRDISHYDNPMQQQQAGTGGKRREKASTVHTSTPSQATAISPERLHPMRRPSPTDMKNLDEFKKGRSSKRATGKTQV